jgi:hypothetical protein
MYFEGDSGVGSVPTAPGTAGHLPLPAKSSNCQHIYNVFIHKATIVKFTYE